MLKNNVCCVFEHDIPAVTITRRTKQPLFKHRMFRLTYNGIPQKIKYSIHVARSTDKHCCNDVVKHV